MRDQDLASILGRQTELWEGRSLGDGVAGGLCLLLLWLVLVKLHEFGEIELWLLEDLDLSNHAVVLQWEDLVALLLHFLTNLFINTIKYES